MFSRSFTWFNRRLCPIMNEVITAIFVIGAIVIVGLVALGRLAEKLL